MGTLEIAILQQRNTARHRRHPKPRVRKKLQKIPTKSTLINAMQSEMQKHVFGRVGDGKSAIC
jgi:hypothetical protein